MVDASGATLMPGLVEGHAHMSFHEATRNTDLGDIPPEEHVLITMHNAKTLLDHGFTSAYSAAAAKLRLGRCDPQRDQCGQNPRTAAARGFARDHRYRRTWRRDATSSGADQFRFWSPMGSMPSSRRCACASVKASTTSKSISRAMTSFSRARGAMTVMNEAEVRAAVETAHAFGRRISAHARATQSIKLAVRNGVDVIYHCDAADEEGLDLLEEAKDRIFVGPAIGLIYSSLYEAAPWGFNTRMHVDLGLTDAWSVVRESTPSYDGAACACSSAATMGFAWVPQGMNARDIEHFVNLFGYSPSEALSVRDTHWRRASWGWGTNSARSRMAISPTYCW